MGNKKYWFISAISLAVVAIFLFGIPSTFIYQRGEGQEIDRLVEQAKLAIEMPKLPGKPEGKTEIVLEGKYLETKVPQFSCKGLKCRTTTKTVRTRVEIPVEKFGPNTIRDWNGGKA